MRRKTPLTHLVYTHLYPHPVPLDPVDFIAHRDHNLIPEVRLEVANFYGGLLTVEARYPALDYCHPPHRMRLGRFPHHRRLFEAFDALELTPGEIRGICCWEGTLWARQRYERETVTKVTDTIGDDIKDRRMELWEAEEEEDGEEEQERLSIHSPLQSHISDLMVPVPEITLISPSQTERDDRDSSSNADAEEETSQAAFISIIESEPENSDGLSVRHDHDTGTDVLPHPSSYYSSPTPSLSNSPAATPSEQNEPHDPYLYHLQQQEKEQEQ